MSFDKVYEPTIGCSFETIKLEYLDKFIRVNLKLFKIII